MSYVWTVRHPFLFCLIKLKGWVDISKISPWTRLLGFRTLSSVHDPDILKCFLSSYIIINRYFRCPKHTFFSIFPLASGWIWTFKISKVFYISFTLAPSWSQGGFRPKKFRIRREISKYFYKNLWIFMWKIAEIISKRLHSFSNI